MTAPYLDPKIAEAYRRFRKFPDLNRQDKDILVHSFAPMIKAMSRTEDEQGAAWVAFFENLNGMDVNVSNPGRDLYFACLNAVREERWYATAIVRVPPATRAVIMRHLRRHDNDVHAAALSAQAAGPEGLTYDSFMAGVKALRMLGTLEPHHVVTKSLDTDDALDHIVVRSILAKLPTPDETLVRLSYGFETAARHSIEAQDAGVPEEPVPLTDAVVGLIMGLTSHKTFLERQRILETIRQNLLSEEPA